jgi:hypothetical protein
VICGGSESAGLVCGAFGLTAGPGASLIPVSRGAVGRVWCLDLGAERYAVKELFEESDEESVRLEVTFTAHLESAGIRLPGSLPGRDGRFLQELAPGPGGGWLRLYRWIDGVPADLADPGLAARIGDLAGRLHALARPARGAVDPWYDRVPGPATWDQLADAARGQGAGWGEAMAGHAGLLGDLAVLDWDDAGARTPSSGSAAHPRRSRLPGGSGRTGARDVTGLGLPAHAAVDQGPPRSV